MFDMVVPDIICYFSARFVTIGRTVLPVFAARAKKNAMALSPRLDLTWPRLPEYT